MYHIYYSKYYVGIYLKWCWISLCFGAWDDLEIVRDWWNSLMGSAAFYGVVKYWSWVIGIGIEIGNEDKFFMD